MPVGSKICIAPESLQINTPSNIFRLFLLIRSLLSVSLSVDYVVRCTKIALAEFLLFISTAGSGGMLLRCANDLVTIYVALECLSLSSYLLFGYAKKDIRSNEATLKFLLMGGASSSFLVYGFSLLYGLSGGEVQLNKFLKMWRHKENWLPESSRGSDARVKEFWDGSKVREFQEFWNPMGYFELPIICETCKRSYKAWPPSHASKDLEKGWKEDQQMYILTCKSCRKLIKSGKKICKVRMSIHK